MRLLYENCLADIHKIESESNVLLSYVDSLSKINLDKNYSFPESFLNLPSDKNILKEIEQVKKEKITGDLKYLIIIGIGGSSLGAKAVYDALIGFDDNFSQKLPKIIFSDTDNPDYLAEIRKLLAEIKNPSEVLINIITKSGDTMETIVNSEVLLSGLDLESRVVVMTNPGSKLEEQARQKGITVLNIPEKVGGRFSVFSIAGMLPVALCGIDASKILNGALSMREKCLNENLEENPALLSAVIEFEHYKNGKNIWDHFFFNSQLESLGKWCRQLIAESLGKDGKGPTPTVSIGTNDLHSMVQLYLGGPKDKNTTFVFVEKGREDETVPADFPQVVSGVSGKKVSELEKTVYEGVKKSYADAGLPFSEILLDDISEFSLGEFMMFKMIEILFLGKMIGVNPFGQPNVEDYKNNVRQALNN
jgi:glucose-6-phosphate isomerase